MFATAWLAISGLPVFVQPLAAAPQQPSTLAIASGEATLRTSCLQLRCADAEWRHPAAATTFAYASDERPVMRAPLPGAPNPRFRLWSPMSARDWMAGHLSPARVGARYGLAAIRAGDTRLHVEVGTGYRWQPHADDGTAANGMVARGRIDWQQRFGPQAWFSQQLRVETGRHNTYVRNALALDVLLQPRLGLHSGLELRHDSAADGGHGSTRAEAAMELRYAF